MKELLCNLKKIFSIFLLSFILYSQAFAAGNDANTVSLLHMDGADASTTFTDNATGGTHTWTASADAQIDTAQSKFGGASGLFDGTGDYISTGDSADYSYGNGSFTIDFWMRWNGTTASDTIYYQTDDGTNEIIVRASAGTSRLHFWDYSGGAYQILTYCSWTPSADTWYHIAWVRDGNTWYVFIDGVSQSLTLQAGSYSATLANIAGNLNIGGNPIGAEYFTGWLDEARISKGIARWTANFTPPTEAYNGAVAPRNQVIWIN